DKHLEMVARELLRDDAGERLAQEVSAIVSGNRDGDFEGRGQTRVGHAERGEASTGTKPPRIGTRGFSAAPRMTRLNPVQRKGFLACWRRKSKAWRCRLSFLGSGPGGELEKFPHPATGEPREREALKTRGAEQPGRFFGKAACVGAGHAAGIETREPAAEARAISKLLAGDAQAEQVSAAEHGGPLAVSPLA